MIRQVIINFFRDIVDYAGYMDNATAYSRKRMECCKSHSETVRNLELLHKIAWGMGKASIGYVFYHAYHVVRLWDLLPADAKTGEFSTWALEFGLEHGIAPSYISKKEVEGLLNG